MKIPEKLTQSIPHVNDPERLREIAVILKNYGWWDKSDEAMRKALEIERQYAEQAAK